MSLQERTEEYVIKIISAENAVLFRELKPEGLRALGLYEDGHYFFMLNPFKTGSVTCTPLNPEVEEKTLYNLISETDVTVLMNGNKIKADLNERRSERWVTSLTRVYPMYDGTESTLLFIELGLGEPKLDH